jgi:hypothetical protein
VNFKHYKHKTSTTPFVLQIEGQQGPYNIAKEMARYLALRGLNDGPLFIYNNKPVTKNFFNNTFQAALTCAKYKQDNYKTQSFRIGAASHCLMKGYTMEQIQFMGRWKSSAFKKYFRVTSFQI